MPRLVSFVVLLVILLILGAIAFAVMASFLLPLFLAILLVVIFQPLHLWITERCRGYHRVAAGITTAIILLIVLLPMVIVGMRAAREAQNMASAENLQRVKDLYHRVKTKLGFHTLSPAAEFTLDQIEATIARLEQGESDDLDATVATLLENVETMRAEVVSPDAEPTNAVRALDEFEQTLKVLAAENPEANSAEFATLVSATSAAYNKFRDSLSGGPLLSRLHLNGRSSEESGIDPLSFLKAPARYGAEIGAAFLGDLIGFVVAFGIMGIALYYFLADGAGMREATMDVLPLDHRYQRQLFNQFISLTRAILLAVVLSALAQALLGGIAYWIVGLKSVFLLTVLTGFLAVIPFVGAAPVWGGAAIWLYYQGHVGSAIFLVVYGVGVISMVDNLIKPLVLQGRANLHPLLALLSVLGGVKVLGPIGIFVGPMVVAFVQSLLVMFRDELHDFEKRANATPVPVIPPNVV